LTSNGAALSAAPDTYKQPANAAWFGRLRHVTSVVTRHAISVAANRIGWRSLSARFTTSGLAGPMRFRVLLEDLGGSFVKFGQVLAVQPDLLPPGYATALLDLLDRVAPVPTDVFMQSLAAELGPAVSRLEDIDPEPLATASIAQVHVARLDGRRVAVKVQRPGIERAFRADVRMMLILLRIVRLFRIRPLYWLDEPIREFAGWTDEELDFRREARHLTLVRRQSLGRKGVRMPEVIIGLTTRRVLVTEYLDGVPMATYMRAVESGDFTIDQRLREKGFDPGAFGRQIIFNFTTDSFGHGLFHADLHPANLLILPGNVVGYVDFGITGSIGPYARTWLAAMTLALVRRDIDDLHRSFLKLVVPRRDADPVKFRVGLDAMADSWYGGPGGTRLKKPAALVMVQMLGLSRETAMLPEREVVKYIRSVMTLDGVVHRFAPDLNLGHEIEQASIATLDAQSGRQLVFAAWAGGLRAIESSRSLATRGMSVVNMRRLGLGMSTTVLQLGAAALACAVCVSRAPLPLRAGFNLGTMELAVGSVALIALAIELVRQTNE
jgi:predicted unusual protein kinase regulating ubiquinone biosynthesis (AarF/ABC1/UbiB family)